MSREYLTYEEFGAVGDGLTDDFSAIIATHEAANEKGLPVKAREGAVYHLGLTPRTAIICTDTDWTGATFLVDHRDLSLSKTPVFRVESMLEPIAVKLDCLVREQKKLDVTFPCDVFVEVHDDSVRHYIRRGPNVNSGSPATDCFVATANGEIKNRIMWDFPQISSAVARPIDKTPLVIRGGTIRNIAAIGDKNEAGERFSPWRYSARNLVISRSNTTLIDFTDEIIDEQEYGMGYSGTVSVRGCAYVTIRNCRFMGRRYYTVDRLGVFVSLGSYALNLNTSAFVSLIGIRQNGDIMDTTRWGLMASNFCKDLLLDDCIMSRFDAHQGVTNCTIRNSRLGWMCLNAIGYGHFDIENCDTYGNALFNLRRDYGSFWNGSVRIKNCIWTPRGIGSSVVNANNDGMHDFGYPCTMPHTIEIDGLKINDSTISGDQTPYYILPNYDPERPEGEKISPYTPTSRLVLRDIATASGRAVEITTAPELYPDLEVN